MAYCSLSVKINTVKALVKMQKRKCRLVKALLRQLILRQENGEDAKTKMAI